MKRFSEFPMDLDDTQLPFTLNEFADALEAAGFFARRYELQALNDLYVASRVIWHHLCALDNGNYYPAKKLEIKDFANCFVQLDKTGLSRILE